MLDVKTASRSRAWLHKQKYIMNNNFIISTNGEVLCKCSVNAEGTITIPEGIVAIKQNAFKGCKEITNVVFPASLKKIGSNAFLGCDKLKSLRLSNGVEYIGKGAFKACRHIESAIIPSSVNELSESIFEDCLSLKYVNLPERGLRIIGDKCFKMCISLRIIAIPSSVVSLGRAFVDCWNLTKVIMKTKKVGIDKKAFEGCSEDLTISCIVTAREFLKSINHYYQKQTKQRVLSKKQLPMKVLWPYSIRLNRLPGWVEIIDEDTFRDWTGLEVVGFPQSVKIIQARAFSGCNRLTQLNIEEGVETIGRNSFAGCMRLANLYLPDSLKDVKDEAFAGCSALKKVSISRHTNVAATAFDANTEITYRK